MINGTLSDDLYTQVLLDAAHHLQCSGSLPTAEAHAALTNASCGDEVSVDVQVSPDKKTITDVKWRGHGCIISQAHMDGVAQLAIGTSVEKVQSWGRSDVLAIFGLTEIASGREKCLTLGLRALQQALLSL